MPTIADYKSKEALEEAMTNGVEIIVAGETGDGEIAIAKYAHFPGPVTWRAIVTLENGKIVKIR